jgi:hypothetical protein
MRAPLVCAIAAIPAALAACTTGAPDYLEYTATQDTNSVAARIAERVGACWFADGETAFTRFAYAPELNSFSGRPRILIVPRANPAGLPQLVVEVSKGKRATVVKLFGPLLASAGSATIQADVERWADGGTEC